MHRRSRPRWRWTPLKGDHTIVFRALPSSSEPDYRLEEAAFGVCGGRFQQRQEARSQGPSVKDLHAKIGQFSMENDFLSNALFFKCLCNHLKRAKQSGSIFLKKSKAWKDPKNEK
jgi:hypothetical protein